MWGVLSGLDVWLLFCSVCASRQRVPNTSADLAFFVVVSVCVDLCVHACVSPLHWTAFCVQPLRPERSRSLRVHGDGGQRECSPELQRTAVINL